MIDISNLTANEAGENNIEFIITRKNTAKPLQAQKETLNFITLLVQLFVVLPWVFAILFRWYNGDVPYALFEK